MAAENNEPWFATAFGAFYTDVYAHRSLNEAEAHLPQIIHLAQLENKSLNILDLGCGQGRYTQLLNQKDYSVIGLDYSHDLLKLAQEQSAIQQFCRGNMLQLPFNACFDRVLSLFTSFGYFQSDEDNRQVLQQMSHVLKHGGFLYLDFLNANLVSESDWEEKSLGQYLQVSKKEILHPDHAVKKSIQLFKDGEIAYQYHEYVKLYDLKWFETESKKVGLKLIKKYGDYSGAEFNSKESPRLIMLFEKV